MSFDDLPDAARRAVTSRAGTVRAARAAGGGADTGVAALLDTGAGRVYVEGVPADHPHVVERRREIALNPHLPDTCPRLLWHVEAGGWVLLGHEAVEGRPADYTRPDDVVLVLAALKELQRVGAPCGVEVDTAPERWGKYADDGEGGAFDGDTLLQADWAPADVLIGAGRARIVDWARPTRGAAWIDPFLLALRLTAAGHSAAVAVSWVQRVASWRAAEPETLHAFAVAVARLWADIAAEDPVPPKVALAESAERLRAWLGVRWAAL
ncbi:aminoglycoside phosphotransferase [Streptomyces sp. NPDC046831]|uniref:aminoglycoside phosphotransferase n=1 Tax=Streptomyces sp. NPDC046831 TaxID=3154805 RepID=UPI0033EFCF69